MRKVVMKHVSMYVLDVSFSSPLFSVYSTSTELRL